MATQTWTEVVTASLQALWTGFMGFLPVFIGAIIVFVIGWIIAVLLGKLTTQIVRSLRIDQILEKIGFKKSLEKANLKLDSGNFLGELVRWFFIVVFLMASTDILGLSEVTIFLKTVLLYIPQLIVAIIILLIAVLVSNFLQKIVKASVEAAGLKSANFLGVVTKWSILVFAFLAALLQLGIVPSLIQTLFTGFVAALTLGIGLSFGLGGKEVAAEFLDGLKKEVRD